MAQNLNLKIKGLYTHPNPHSEVPQGALLIANNITINRESLATTRRGNRVDETPIGITYPVTSATFYQDEIVYHDDNDDLYHKIPDGTITAYGSSLAPPTGTHIRYRESNRKLFMTSDDGIHQLVGVDASDYNRAGMPRGLDMSYSLAAGSTLGDNAAYAYRVVWGTRDAFDYIVLGSPSERLVIINPAASGDQDATITITIPDSITTSDFFRLYRSDPSATASSIPNDELQLVFEGFPDATDITNGYVIVTDIVPDELKRDTIYTAPSQEGITNANSNPPHASDMELFKNHMFFSNTKLRHNATVTLLAVGSPNGLQDGDTITIDSIVYTFKTTPVGSTDVQLYTAGTPSENIDDSSRELVKVINAYALSTVNAYYTSGFNDLPGEFYLEFKDFDPTGFTITASRTGVFDPPSIFTGGYDSSNDEKVNRVYFSKPQQPEAVPLGQYFDVGSEEDEILRIVALREALFILKNKAIYRIVGTDADTFRVIQSDTTTSLLAAETAVVHNNSLFMFSDQGVVSVSENGDVAIQSHSIEQDLLEISKRPGFDNSFAVSYESDREYILWTLGDTDNRIDTAYVYNSITEAWTTWEYDDININNSDEPYHTVEMHVQLVHPNRENNNLYSFLDNSGDEELWIERKSYTLQDHHDGEITVTADNQPDTTHLELDTAYAGQAGLVGATLQQNEAYARIKSVSAGGTGTILELDIPVTWDLLNDLTILVPIDISVKWVPISANNPGKIKKWMDFAFIFEDSSFASLDLTFKTDFGGGDVTNTLEPDTSELGWGFFPWGNSPWGGEIGILGRQVIPSNPTREAIRGHWMEVTISSKQADQRFGLAGISAIFKDVGSKFRGAAA